MQRERVGVVIGFYEPAFRAGGPIQSIAAMAKNGCSRRDFFVLTSNADLGTEKRLDVAIGKWVVRKEAFAYYFREGSIVSWLQGLRALREADVNYLYLNGTFSIRLSLVPALLWKIGFFRSARLVVAPRGEFGTGALAIKSAKKRLYLWCLQMFGVYKGAVWHASSAAEEWEVRNVFPDADVVVKLNDTDLPRAAQLGEYENYARDGLLRLTYVGRVSPKKGLHILLDGLSGVVAQVHLDVFGLAEDPNYLEFLTEKVRVLPANVTVEFKGAIGHEAVIGTFSRYDYFTFPTSHENFGHVIAESMAGCCPVIAPPVTAFTEQILRGGGMIVHENNATCWSEVVTYLATKDVSGKLADRSSVRTVYNEWRLEQDTDSVFDLIIDMQQSQ